ncbi:hypothetical protein EDB80DRAFT_710858 [Ilyonectria destructans]|nr:hypothetical protein EDB80DRAFT_710858 [Ilyonectria destructans]
MRTGHSGLGFVVVGAAIATARDSMERTEAKMMKESVFGCSVARRRSGGVRHRAGGGTVASFGGLHSVGTLGIVGRPGVVGWKGKRRDHGSTTPYQLLNGKQQPSPKRRSEVTSKGRKATPGE